MPVNLIVWMPSPIVKKPKEKKSPLEEKQNQETLPTDPKIPLKETKFAQTHKRGRAGIINTDSTNLLLEAVNHAALATLQEHKKIPAATKNQRRADQGLSGLKERLAAVLSNAIIEKSLGPNSTAMPVNMGQKNRQEQAYRKEKYGSKFKYLI
jgi:hypothetical protein